MSTFLLDAYVQASRLAVAMQTSHPYMTRLNPFPGPSADEQSNFLPLPDWKAGAPRLSDWPPHIRPPEVVAEVHACTKETRYE